MAIKLLENSYKQLNKDILECQVEEKRIDVPKSNLADHLTLRSKIEELEKRRADLRTMLDQLIKNHEKTSKDSNGKDDNSTSGGGKQTGNTSKPPKGERPKDTQTGKSNPGAKENKPDKKTPAKIVKVKENPKIIFNLKVVKPGKKFAYTVVPPKHYLNPKIVWIKCSSNLSTITGAPMTKNLRGYLVADSLITRAQNASVTVFLRDLATPRQYGQATAGIVISTYTQERKIGLKIPSRMLSGRTYNFLITVPPDFKRPFSIHVKSSLGKHLIVNSNTTSLAGSLKAWGNGNPDLILSGSVSAKVYDDSGKIGYINKLVAIDEPTQEELDKIPMEEPPTWYEEAASAAWKATKTGLKTTGQVMQALADAEAKHGYLKNASKPNNSYSPPKNPTPKYNLTPPKKPHWMTPKPIKPSDPNAQNLGKIITRYPSITIIAWDHSDEDGDKVKISLNGAALGSISLKNAKQSCRLSLRSGHNEVKITALNQGTSGPNTASFEVHDKSGKLTKKSWDLLTGKSAILIAIYKP